PEKVSIGTDFFLVANWLVTTSHLQQLIVKYDEEGDFSSLTLQLLYLADESEK
ncbi:MAG TPA: hypothetical protein VLA84_12345, partial [Microcoleus sp.]|nr:hypothetical protein [Microcoleus sp.]